MEVNPYEGHPPRAWVNIILVGPQRHRLALRCIADTGSPFDLIIGESVVRDMRYQRCPTVRTNYGEMIGGELRVLVKEASYDRMVHGYGADSVVQAVQASLESFEGVVGLPFLRQFQYGGDGEGFWLRSARSDRGTDRGTT